MVDNSLILSVSDIQIPHHAQGDVLTELRIAIQERGVITVEDWKRAVRVSKDADRRAESDGCPVHSL